MGLSDTYVQVRGQILLMDPLPSLNKVFSLLTQEERQSKWPLSKFLVQIRQMLWPSQLNMGVLIIAKKDRGKKDLIAPIANIMDTPWKNVTNSTAILLI